MAPIIEFRNISFARGEREIFQGLSFAVNSRDKVALLGPNGVGKSTLLALISGLLRPASGRILLQGRDIKQWTRRELSCTVALIPQSLEVPFTFRVEEIVAQGRVPHLGRFGSLSRHDVAVVERSLDALDIQHLRGRIYQELSGGERQRVKIAIGLAQEPKVMLLDEPTQHLDIGRQIEIVTLLQRLNDTGITIIAAVHDLAVARRNFSTGILLTGEPACFTGPLAEVMSPQLLELAFGAGCSTLGSYVTLDTHPPDARQSELQDLLSVKHAHGFRRRLRRPRK